MTRAVFLTSFSLLFHVAAVGISQTHSPAQVLISELGCAGCHSGLPDSSDIHDLTPDLSDAGLRFNPAYLFAYLQNPTKVRPHIWPTRMPNFKLYAEEALALVLYLETQREERLPDAELPFSLRGADLSSPDMKGGRSLLARYECLKCHNLAHEGQAESADLADIGMRLQPGWVRKYLIAPYRFDGRETVMPTYFFSWDDREGAFSQLLPEATADINLLTAYLFELSQDKRTALEEVFEKAKRDHPHITADMGATIFNSQNCVACHRFGQVAALPWKNAPDLSFEGARVKADWLRTYLRSQTPLRPFGYYPGTGSRMPDFGLSDNEATLLADFLLKGVGRLASTVDFQPQKLSAFASKKAGTLLREKLACLGCHQLGDEGGRIAPSLSSVKSRLRPEYIYQMLKNPKAADPQVPMPGLQRPDKQIRLIANFLMQQDSEKPSDEYLSLLDHPTYFYVEGNDSEKTFLRYCAACHGADGQGDGFNARYLPTEPTKHTDADYLSTRPDDTLFDGIYAGGAILNKSHLMPPWGSTLTTDQIRKLVRHIRAQCQCKGPSWSEDNQ